ncbi:MAG TPA: DNA replication and repair protein RecF [Acidimicrobiales bacterium]|nr:DNA replication and repair protein RecF [Acidimicrobiales bacterium]
MAVTDLWVVDFRCFTDVHVQLEPEGVTVLRGPNGAGKTSVLEALAWLATQRSMRGAPRDALVRVGEERAIVRARLLSEGRDVTIEAELPRQRGARSWVNRRLVGRRAELAAVLQVTVFSPDDLQLVQGGPATRREYLDDVLADGHPRMDALTTDVERAVRQRTALLRQLNGRLDDAAASSLDVWDERLARAGTDLADARAELVGQLQEMVADAYSTLARTPERVTLAYERSWDGALGESLRSHRDVDVRRQVTSVGPHRDELVVALSGRPVRTLASQGEQRCVALALRLASHELRRRSSSESPLLLLDDVFSELDARRSEALLGLLPAGQVLLTTATAPPDGVRPARTLEVVGGALVGTDAA